MSNKVEEYQTALRTIINVAKTLTLFDIPELLQDIERADAFGCFIDPTLWIKKHKAMMEDKVVFEAALPLYRLAKKIQQEQTNENKIPS